MVRAAGSYHLRGIEPQAAEKGVVGRDTSTIVPLVLFYCTVCGYVETYYEVTTDPERWARR